MKDTQEHSYARDPTYRSAQTYRANPVAETSSFENAPRAIYTSQTEGILKVIIVSKPVPTRVVDKSTS